METLLEPYVAIRDYMEAGGPVLLAILFVAILLWALIIERFLYLWVNHPRAMSSTVGRWQARRDNDSWYAKQIRLALISQVSSRLDRNLLLIRTLIAICPLLGLLGTVTGMIHVFDIMAITGTGNARGMAEGISRATLPTMSGLVIALSGVFFSARLDQRARLEREKLADLLRTY